MSEEIKVPEGETEYEKPAPAVNPRDIALKEIAASRATKVEAEFAADNNVPSVDDDHNITPAPTPAPAAAAAEPATPSAEPAPTSLEPSAPAGAPDPAAIDPAGEYEVTVEGQKVRVKGQTIIDAGFRTLQKEAAADHKLQLASRLLEEAEARSRATPTGATEPAKPAPSEGPTVEELAHDLQFGTPEKSAAAVRELRKGGISEERLAQMTEERARLAARDELEFQRGKAYLAREHKDLMEKPAIKRLFESEDARLLEAGDRRPYIVRYGAIAEQLRKDFGLAKPAAPATPSSEPAKGSAAARQQAKASTPSVPRTAAARLGEGEPAEKPKSNSDVIAAMAAARGKNRLSDPPPNRR